MATDLVIAERRGSYPPGQGEGLVIFDADDTLWFTEPLYDAARSECKSVVRLSGLDSERWEIRERAIDIANVQRFGLKRERFPTSCVEAYVEVAGSRYDTHVAEEIARIARRVFTNRAELADGVPEVLLHLGAHFRLLLLTQGDRQVQRKRLRDAGLRSAFDEVHVLDRKSTASFERILQVDGRSAKEGWSIGNSLPSDINPALSLGMNAIWIPAHVWEHERREVVPHPGKLIQLESLREVESVLLGPG